MKKTRFAYLVMAIAVTALSCLALDYSNRKYNNDLESLNPLGSVIVNADCVFENGKFIMKSLPAPLPSLFTIRFTAPEDFTQGNTIVVNDSEMPLRVPAMINASTAIFRAGAVFHVDIDMDREVAFAWANQGGSGTGTIPDLSFDEQFAGYYDWNGDRVYCKSIDMGRLTNKAVKNVYHNIANMKRLVKDSPVFSLTATTDMWASTLPTGASIALQTTSEFCHFNTNADFSLWSCIQTLYYTCTDR